MKRVAENEAGEIDVETITASTDSQLEIQRMTAARESATHDLSGNKLRATYVWPEFHRRAIREHGKLKLDSQQVKNIHRENGLDMNPNTIRRTMQMVAKYTGQGTADELAPDASTNLVRFKPGGERGPGANSMLVAEQDEWDAHYETLVASIANRESTMTDTESQTPTTNGDEKQVIETSDTRDARRKDDQPRRW